MNGSGSKNREVWQGVLMLAWLGLLAWGAVRSVTPPAPHPAAAPANEFSAERALTSLREIAQSPHPQGSTEHERIRETLMTRLRELGLSPHLQTTPVVGARTRRPYRAGTVHNVWARIPGQKPTGTLLLAAHYDSVNTGPGASDDGASVAALLETLRALQSGSASVAESVPMPVSFQSPPPNSLNLRNDLIVLLTDGEETGLLGARAFVEALAEGERQKETGESIGTLLAAPNPAVGLAAPNPQSKIENRKSKIPSSLPLLVLNFEARGTSGPSLMFETSPGNGWLAQQFAQAAPQPLGSSLFYEVYKRLPNDTDFTEFRAGGMMGLNFAYLNRVVHYHTRLDDVERLDRRSLQHHGDNMLHLARQFGNAVLPQTAQPDAIYFNLTRTRLCVYPLNWAVPLALLTTLLTMVVGIRAWRSNRQDGKHYWRDLAGGFLRVGLATGGVMLMLAGLSYWLASGAESPRMTLYLDNTTLAGVVLLSTGSCLLLMQYKWKSASEGIEMGAVGWWLLLTWLTALLLPGGSYLFTWPLLGVLVMELLRSAPRKGEQEEATSPAGTLACRMPGAIPALLLIVPTLCLLFETLSVGSLAVIGALTALTVALLHPQITHAARIFPTQPQGLPLLLTGMGAVFLWIGAEALQPSETRPHSNSIFYALDADTHAALWASNDRKPDAWTTQFLGKHPDRSALSAFLPVSSETFLHAPAPLAPLAPPAAVVESDRTENGVRELRLHLTSPRHAPLMEMAVLPDVRVLDAEIEGRPVNGNEEGRAWSLLYFAIPESGLTLTLRVPPAAPITLRVIDRAYGLPDIPGKTYTPRPADMMASPASGWYQDTTLIAKTFRF